MNRSILVPGRPVVLQVEGDMVTLPSGSLAGLTTATVDDLCLDFLAAVEAAPRPAPPVWVATEPHQDDGSRDGLRTSLAGVSLGASWSPDTGAAMFLDASAREVHDLATGDARAMASALTRIADAVEAAEQPPPGRGTRDEGAASPFLLAIVGCIASGLLGLFSGWFGFLVLAFLFVIGAALISASSTGQVNRDLGRGADAWNADAEMYRRRRGAEEQMAAEAELLGQGTAEDEAVDR